MFEKVIINRSRFGDSWYNYHYCIIKKLPIEEYGSFFKKFKEDLSAIKEHSSSVNYQKGCAIISFSALCKIEDAEHFQEFTTDIMKSDLVALANVNSNDNTKRTLSKLRILVDTTSSEIVKNF